MDEKRFAVLIDAENVSNSYIKYILDEISNYGNVTYKRIYGDWTSAAAAGWKKQLLENSITPVQQYSYTYGKNATDSAMIIDAMDILYSGNVDGFCLVSSDSDFTKLAMRLRESGMMVIGMGEKKTPKPFSVACNVFKYLEVLMADAEAEAAEEEKSNQDEAGSGENMTDIDTILKAMVNIINENGDEEKGISIGELGNLLLKRYPDFDVRNYGYTKLSKFLSAFDGLSLSRHNNVLFVSLRQNHLDADTVRSAIVAYVRDWERARNGKLNLGQLNQWLTEQFPQFNVKNYGYTTFVKFVSDIHGLSVRSSGKNGRIKHVQLIQ